MIPTYAGNHHKVLDGSGYPNHLSKDELPWPCRLITILDIFEALTVKFVYKYIKIWHNTIVGYPT